MSKEIAYENYFQDHYWYDFSEKDLQIHRQWFQAQFDIIKDKLHNSFDNKKILEIWSATGSFYQFLEWYSCDYVGIEMDQSAVDRANNRFWNKFISTSIENYVWEWYDYIFAFEVLEHVKNPIEVIEKIKKLLKSWWIFIGTSPYPFKKNVYADKTHRFCLTDQNWKKIFDDNWFNTKVEPLSFIPYVWRISSKLNFRIPFYISIKHFISTTLIFAQS